MKHSELIERLGSDEDSTISKLVTRAIDMAGQENCDGEEYDMIQELSEALKKTETLLKATIAELQRQDTPLPDDEQSVEKFAALLMALEIPPSAAALSQHEIRAIGRAIAHQAKQVEPLQSRIEELEKWDVIESQRNEELQRIIEELEYELNDARSGRMPIGGE